MDALGFQTWLSDLGRKFPAIREWLRTLAPGDQDGLLDSWELAVADLDLVDCLQVNQRMVSGEFDPPGEWPAQWQGIPAKVRRGVARLIGERQQDGPTSERERYEHRRNLLAREKLKAGVPRDQVSRELVAAGFEGIAVDERQVAT